MLGAFFAAAMRKLDLFCIACFLVGAWYFTGCASKKVMQNCVKVGSNIWECDKELR